MNKKLISVLCLLLIIFFYSIFISKIPARKPGATSVALVQPSPVAAEHSSHLFDGEFYNQAYAKGEQYKKQMYQNVMGGIIPHHLLAAPLIAGFFEGMSKQKVTTVILLSPNHYGTGQGNAATSMGRWTTVFGDLETDSAKVSRLMDDEAVTVDEDIFNNEHGIYSIAPFIKKTFPEAKMVPVVLKNGIARQELDDLVRAINDIADGQTIIIVSADFSHYLPSVQADARDRTSIGAITSFDTDRVLGLDSTQNVDSPESVYVLQKAMQLKGADKPILLSNTNSAKLTNQPGLQSTTSYATMYFVNQTKEMTRDSIFNYHDPVAASVRNNNTGEVTIIATGDIIPARSVNAKVTGLNNFDFPYDKTREFLKSGDAVFVNLESPLIPDCRTTITGMIFCGDERNVIGLVDAGVTVADIANNHAGNYGINGINSTVNLLKKNNIGVTGNGEAAIVAIKGKKFGFLGYNSIGAKEQGIAWADPVQIASDIQNLRKQVDFVIAAFHWGVEYTSSPTDFQRELAHTAVDAGADLIIGNHPHWVQGVEQYKGKFITYAHGNYIFDQMWSQETREGVLGRYTFDNEKLINIEFIPIIIDDYSQARFATQVEAVKILERMKSVMLPFTHP